MNALEYVLHVLRRYTSACWNGIDRLISRMEANGKTIARSFWILLALLGIFGLVTSLWDGASIAKRNDFVANVPLVGKSLSKAHADANRGEFLSIPTTGGTIVEGVPKGVAKVEVFRRLLATAINPCSDNLGVLQWRSLRTKIKTDFGNEALQSAAVAVESYEHDRSECSRIANNFIRIARDNRAL